jgi:hypothetical protein
MLDLAAVAEHAGVTTATVHHDAIAIGLAPDQCLACGAKTTAWVPPAPDASDEEYFFDSCAATPSPFVFDASSELAGPQPTVPICPDCPLVVTSGSGRGLAYLSMDSSYLDGSVSWKGANLVLVQRSGQRTVVDLPMSTVLDDLTNGRVVAFELAGAWHDLTHASINAVFTDGRTGDSFVRGNELLLVFR